MRAKLQINSLISFKFIDSELLMSGEDKVDEAIETVEVMTDIAENLGEAAEKLAEAVEKKIPDEDSKLKEAVEAVDRLAKEAVKEAEEAKRLIHEVPLPLPLPLPLKWFLFLLLENCLQGIISLDYLVHFRMKPSLFELVIIKYLKPTGGPMEAWNGSG